MPFTPESREMAKQHTLRRAKMNSDLEQLNKMLEMKEKIANQMAQDNNLQALKEQYEVKTECFQYLAKLLLKKMKHYC